jgi:ribosome assembly protein 1
MVVDVMPNPRDAMKSRSRILFDSSSEDGRIVKSVSTCDRSEDAPVVVFVTKLFEVDSRSLSDYNEDDDDDKTTMLGFARVFSGVLKHTTRLYLNGAKALPTQVQLYLMMGNRQFRKVNTVSAGSVVAIRHLDKCVDKFATLVSEKTQCNMSRMHFRTRPIVCLTHSLIENHT